MAQNHPLWRLIDICLWHYALSVVYARNDDEGDDYGHPGTNWHWSDS